MTVRKKKEKNTEIFTTKQIFFELEKKKTVGWTKMAEILQQNHICWNFVDKIQLTKKV